MATFDIGNKIQIVSKVANIDNNYGPYTGMNLSAALANAHNALGPLREIGLTVGILLNGEITEYWYRSGKDNVTDLVAKGASDSVSDSLYTAYSVLVNNAIAASPEALPIGNNSVLGRIMGDIQSVMINNSLAGTFAADDTIASTKAIKNYIDTVVSGSFKFQGGYDAFSNSPNLDSLSSPNGILTGWTYIVTVQGQFFDEQLQVGDHIIAEINNPTLKSHWTIVPNGINSATESITGIIRIASQAEVNAGALDNIAITPLKLKTFLGIGVDKSLPRKYSIAVNPAGTANVSFTYTHGLNTQNAIVSIRDNSFPFQEVEAEILMATANTITVNFSKPPAAGKYQLTIIG